MIDTVSRYALGYSSHTDRVRVSRAAALYAELVLAHIADTGSIPTWVTTDPDVAAGVARHLLTECAAADRTDTANVRTEPALYETPDLPIDADAAVTTCRDLRRLLIAELGDRPAWTAAHVIDGYADGVIAGATDD